MKSLWILVTVFGCLAANDLVGDNVCIKEVNKIFHVTKKFNQTVQLMTTEPCSDFTQGFKCPVKKMGSKVSYKTVPETRKVNASVCCDGYIQSGRRCVPGARPPHTCDPGLWGETCTNLCECRVGTSTCEALTGECHCNPGYVGDICDKPCDEGKFGLGCNKTCDACHEGSVCDPILGCTPIALASAAYTEQQSLLSDNSSFKIGFGGILLFILVALFAGIGIYYRRKYKREKTPQLPKVVYQSKPVTEADSSPTEFRNYMYSREPEMTDEEKHLESLKIGSNTKSGMKNQNLYEDLHSGGPSSPPSRSYAPLSPPNHQAEDPCTEPLLSSDTTPSLESQH